jgi:beta-xylosidase
MAMWAPSIVKKGKQYFLFFSANDIQSSERKGFGANNPDKDDKVGGIGIAVASKPEGPYKDYLGKPLINQFYNKAQPIDQAVFHDKDGQFILFTAVGDTVILPNLNLTFQV